MKNLHRALVGLFAIGAASAGELAVIDSRTHHLGFEGEREWRDLDGSTPEGRSLQVQFTAKPNSHPATLFIRQRDVKLKWPVLLNGRKLGTLDLMEVPQVATLTIPPEALRDGENNLSILSPEAPDDIFIEEIQLDSRSPEQALGEATVRVRVLDKTAKSPLPCRITIADDRGALAALHPLPGQSLAARAGVIYTGDGAAAFGLPAGSYTIYATRGPEYGVAEQKLTVRPGATEEVALEIEREVATPNLVACDTHIHTYTFSKHGDATSDERVLTLAGEGIELAIASDHNLHVDYSEAAYRLKVADYFTYVIGNEVTTPTGHFIAFPVTSATTAVPNPKQTDWAALMTSVRQVPNVSVVVLNHPRDTHNAFRPFDPANFNPVTGENLRGPEFTVDAIEVCNSGTLQSDFMQSFRDWFALLNYGYRIVAVGLSDSHDVSRFIVGQGRTYISCDDRQPNRIDVDDACQRLKSGHAYVSMGLFTDLVVGERFRVGDLATPMPDEIPVTIQVQGSSWAQADRVELFANGVKVYEQRIAPSAKPVKARIEWRIPRPAHDVHLVAIASGPAVTAPYWAIPLPYQPTQRSRERHVIGATNPVWVDADGDGKFTAARAYAKSVIERSGTNPEKLVPALAQYDDAVAAQAAGLCHAAGVDVRGTAFATTLSRCPEQVRRGFKAFAASLGQVTGRP